MIMDVYAWFYHSRILLISIQESQVPSEPISSSPQALHLRSLACIYFLSPDWVAQTDVPWAGQSANRPWRRNRVSRGVATRPEHRLLFRQHQHGRPAAAFHPRRPGVCIAGQAGLVIGPYHHPATPPKPPPLPSRKTEHTLSHTWWYSNLSLKVILWPRKQCKVTFGNYCSIL